MNKKIVNDKIMNGNVVNNMAKKVSKTEEVKIVKKDSVETLDDVNKKTSQLKKMTGETEEISTTGVSRFRVDLKKGLSEEQVNTRIEEGLVNKVDKGSTKTIPHIIFSNIFTTFNIIVMAVSIWLISVDTGRITA